MQRLFRNVLVPYDFSPYAARALAVALQLAREERGRVTVLHAIPRPPYDDLATAQVQAAIEAKGHGELQKLLHSGMTWRVGPDGTPLH